MSQTSEVWNTLQENGLVFGDEPEKAEPDSPWYVKTLLAFSGWLASIFVLVFLGIAFSALFDSPSTCFIVGGLMIAAAFYILRLPKSEFYEHLGLALSLAGQALIIIALFKITDKNQALAWALSAAFQMVLALLMPNFVHRVFSAFFSALCLSIALSEIGVAYLFSGVVMFVSAWVWLNEFTYPQYHKMFSAIGYGLILALVQMKGSALFLHGAMTWSFNHTTAVSWAKPWIGEVLSCTILLFVVWQLLKMYKVAMNSAIALVALASALVIGIASLEANGITVGLMIILLGFSASNRTLMGLGVVSLLFYVSSYYYLLDATLLEKSATIALIGVTLLLIRWALVHGVIFKKGLSDA